MKLFELYPYRGMSFSISSFGSCSDIYFDWRNETIFRFDSPSSSCGSLLIGLIKFINSD